MPEWRSRGHVSADGPGGEEPGAGGGLGSPPGGQADQALIPSRALALAGTLVVSACQAKPAEPPPAPARTPPPGLASEAFEAYEAAKAAVVAGDLLEARRQFLIATAAQSDFTEAWYNVGAASTRLAIREAGAGRDIEALAFFREGVDQKKRAQELINEGRWFVYRTAEERDQVISDLRNALQDADAVLADEASLLAALRLWATSGRR